jgi:hypothetical protein
VPNSRGKIRNPKTKDVNYFLRCPEPIFVNFVTKCFTWEAEDRLTPAEALVEDWILEGLPKEIRTQHLLQMQKTAPHLDLHSKLIKYGVMSQPSAGTLAAI